MINDTPRTNDLQRYERMGDTHMKTRAMEFCPLLVLSDKLQARRRREIDRMQGAYEDACQRAYKNRHPKGRKVRAFRELPQDIIQEVRETWQPRADALMSRYDTLRKVLDERLTATAESHPLNPTAERLWTKYVTVSSYDYVTQGLGAQKYAEGAAQRMADKAAAFNVPVEIRRRDTGRSRWGTWIGDYTVWVALDPTAARALRLRPGLSLVETVRRCWSRGVNPRVYNPFLPPGFEEQHGLDYFGGYKADRSTLNV